VENVAENLKLHGHCSWMDISGDKKSAPPKSAPPTRVAFLARSLIVRKSNGECITSGNLVMGEKGATSADVFSGNLITKFYSTRSLDERNKRRAAEAVNE